MDTSSWRLRVMLEPRGFMRIIEVILAIVAFATTGGYSGTQVYSISACPGATPSVTPPPTGEQYINAPINYPFRLYSAQLKVKNCTGNEFTFTMHGDLSPSAEWFMFVSVTAFLYALGAIVFYVVFDSSVRLTHERVVTIADFVVTVLYSFLWLTAASAWAWGLGQVKAWSGEDQFFKYDPLPEICKPSTQVTCSHPQMADFSPLTASVAFGFLNCFLWICNCWFAYKETPYHEEPGKEDQSGMTDPPNNM